MWKTEVLVDFLQVRRKTLRRKHLGFPPLPYRRLVLSLYHLLRDRRAQEQGQC
jgi:hypothetical protein